MSEYKIWDSLDLEKELEKRAIALRGELMQLFAYMEM
jgi:hypothetical protein